MKIYLDDERQTPDGWKRTFTVAQTIKLLETGDVTEISLDHDLGNDDLGTGYDVILWIEEAVFLRNFKPPLIYVHSSNASARQKMMLGVQAIECAYHLLATQPTTVEKSGGVSIQ